MPKGHRQLHVNVKTAKGRKISSTLWLKRQLNDPYVQLAKQEGYRSRAAYKLKEINEKFSLIKKNDKVVDLGAAPGGWSQIAVAIAGKDNVVAIDILDMDSIVGVGFIKADFTQNEALDALNEALNGQKLDLVMSDMAAPSCGHKETDHIRIISLCELAIDFAISNLKPGGNFVAKILRGGTEHDLLNNLKQNFKKVKHHKPDSSRQDSSEMYVVALDFCGKI